MTAKNTAPLEHDAQSTYFDWVRRVMRPIDPRYHYVFSIPNELRMPSGIERGRRIIVANYFKKEGKEKGVPDIFIDWPARHRSGEIIVPGARFEHKRVGGVLSDEQEMWLSRYRAAGFYTHVCWSVDELMEETQRYFERDQWGI